MMTGSADTVAGFPAGWLWIQCVLQGVRQGVLQVPPGVRSDARQASGSEPIFMINLSEAASSPNSMTRHPPTTGPGPVPDRGSAYAQPPISGDYAGRCRSRFSASLPGGPWSFHGGDG